jgi:hypothetical protein
MSWIDADVSKAALPVVASLLTLWLSQLHSRRMAREDRKHDEVQRRQDQQFQSREARYSDRRAAVVAFIASASDETDGVARFEQEHPGLSPFDLHDDYLFPKLNGAYANLVVVASPDVVEAATKLRQAVFDCFAGSKGGWPAYTMALTELQDAARAMLVDDAAERSAAKKAATRAAS